MTSFALTIGTPPSHERLMTARCYEPERSTPTVGLDDDNPPQSFTAAQLRNARRSRARRAKRDQAQPQMMAPLPLPTATTTKELPAPPVSATNTSHSRATLWHKLDDAFRALRCRFWHHIRTTLPFPEITVMPTVGVGARPPPPPSKPELSVEDKKCIQKYVINFHYNSFHSFLYCGL